MQDRPTALELLDAVRGFLEDHVVPALDGPRRFHARVAANVLTIVDRELRDGEEQQRAEWRRLGVLLGVPGDPTPPERASDLRDGVLAFTRELAARIRAGAADVEPFRGAVLAHLRATVEDKLRIANPRYLAEAS
jgi:hypothetical protein